MANELDVIVVSNGEISTGIINKDNSNLTLLVAENSNRSNDFEPNDNFESAHNLGTFADDVILENLAISTANDLDYYKFTLSEAKLLNVYTAGEANGDTILTIYDSNFNEIAYNDDKSADYYSEIIKFFNAGTYYIQVKTYSKPINNYSLTVNNFTPTPVTVTGENYSTIIAYDDVTVKTGTQVDAYFPGGIQVLLHDTCVTLENCTISCNSIRNAAILFGDDAYWPEQKNGTVTFTGDRITLNSKVSNCITAAGIVGLNLTVNFTDDADNSKNIIINASQETGPGNFAYGIKAKENLIINGNFGGSITSYFDFSTLTTTRWAYVGGFYADCSLTVNGNITGTIFSSAYTTVTSEAYGLHGFEGVSVSGKITGTIVSLAETAAYGIYSYSAVNVAIDGVIYAGKSKANETSEAFMAKLNNYQSHISELTERSANDYAICCDTGSVEIDDNAVIFGDISIWKGNITISSTAQVFGDIAADSTDSNITFKLGEISENVIVTGSVECGKWSTNWITIDANKALNGQYILSTTQLKEVKFTVEGEEFYWVCDDTYKSFSFKNGMNIKMINNAGNTVINVSGSKNKPIPDTQAPIFDGESQAAVNRNKVSISWTAASDNKAVAGYQIRYGTDSTLSGEGFTVKDTVYSVSGLENGTYYYQMRAYDAAGNFSDWSQIESFTIADIPAVYLDYEVPQAEYMYGCTATCIGMLLGYYDRYGYLGYDASYLISGMVESNARGLDGDMYDMDAFDTVLGSAIASEEYKERFVDAAPAEEFNYTFTNTDSGLVLNTSAWNSIADYLGTGQYWRGNEDTSTSFFLDCSLKDIMSWTGSGSVSAGDISVSVPHKYASLLYGLSLYVEKAGYKLDAANTINISTDNNNDGSFTYEDFCKEIDAGRAVLLHLEGHSVLAYGYDKYTNEVIFDDTYKHDCRMQWGGEYYYANENRAMYSVSLIRFDTSQMKELPEKPAAPTAIPSTTSITNKDVTVSAVFAENSVLNEYSFDQINWFAYDGTLTADVNKTFYFRSKDIRGNYSDVTVCKIENIDKTPPAQPVAQASVTVVTNQPVTITVTFSEDSVVRQFKCGNEAWQDYTDAFVVSENCTVSFRAEDAAGNENCSNLIVDNIDNIAPQNPQNFAETISGYTAQLDWDDVEDDGISGVYGYYIRWGASRALSGNGTFTAESNFTMENLAIGSYYYQTRVEDKAGNVSDWSNIQSFEIFRVAPQNLQGSADRLTWEAVPDVTDYIVEYSTDNFNHIISLRTSSCQINSIALPGGNYQWRVKTVIFDLISSSKNISAGPNNSSAQYFVANSDGNTDIFFANANGKWGAGYAAQHTGILNGWSGTNEQVTLAGKNKLADIFEGSNDANILVMTDDTNGDVLFVEDVYTAFGNQARFSQIDEIRAGAGDDIIDMTSQRYAYEGDGIKIYGGLGNDTIWANNGSNTIFGDAGNDRIIGGADNDVIVGGIGNDSMHGGGGDDIFSFGGNWGKDTVEQLADGKVTLWFENGEMSNLNASTLTYTDGENSVRISGISADKITLIFGDDASLRYDELTSAGCFDDAASEKIFEDKNKGMLA